MGKALAEFHRAPDTGVTEVGSRVVQWGDITDATRSMPPIFAALPLLQLYQNGQAGLVEEKALAEQVVKIGPTKIPDVRRGCKPPPTQRSAGI